MKKHYLEFVDAEYFKDYESLNEFILDSQMMLKDVLPAIHFAAENGALDIVKKLLDFRPDLLNSKDDLEQTPLLWASANGHLNIVIFLLYLGADVSVSTYKPGHRDHNLSPLHWAVLNGHPLVVSCLLSYGANPNIRIGKAKRHPIHYASKKGNLDTVKILIENNSDCLEYKDIYNKTPLMHASANGHSHVVKHLLSLDADLYACTHAHKNTALNLALNNKKYETANLLILKEMHQQKEINLLPFIESGLQAILLMKKKPSLIDLLIANDRIRSLIIDEESNRVLIQPNTIHLYKTAGKRKSFYTRIDTSNSTVSVFKPVCELGSGTFGSVRLFQDDKKECIAIKSPIKNTDELSRDKKEEMNDSIIREAQFNALAYPNKDGQKICTFGLFGKKNDAYTYRYIMPFNNGERADIVISVIYDVYRLTHLILKIAEELHRIHKVGILHRDVYEKNILIFKTEDDFIVRFVDFGYSCSLTDATVDLFLIDNVIGNRWYAPEICVTSKENMPEIKPHTNQDVYSLGYFLNNHVFNQELFSLFPIIKTFMSSSQNSNPEERPSLESFCKLLKNELFLNPKVNSDILKLSSFSI